MPKASERAIALAKEVLAKCMAYDPHFPNPSEATLMAWAEHISLANPERDDMLAAVTKFYENSLGVVKPLPASISILARQIRQDRLVRGDYQPPPDKSADPPPPSPPEAKKITLAEWEELHGEKFPRIALGLSVDDPNLSGPNPLRAHCPHCKAPPGSPCVIPGTQQRLEKARAHDARFAVMENRCAASAGWHVTPHSPECERA